MWPSIEDGIVVPSHVVESTPTPTIRFQYPRSLQVYAGGESELILAGETVRQVLNAVQVTHPALYRCVCDETDAIRPHLHLFVNLDMARDRRELEIPLNSGDTVAIYQAVSGG